MREPLTYAQSATARGARRGPAAGFLATSLVLHPLIVSLNVPDCSYHGERVDFIASIGFPVRNASPRRARAKTTKRSAAFRNVLAKSGYDAVALGTAEEALAPFAGSDYVSVTYSFSPG